MPLYEVAHKESNERQELFLSWSRLQDWLANNPDWKLAITAPVVNPDPIRWGLQKAPEAWRKKLSGMKKAHKGSTINDLGG